MHQKLKPLEIVENPFIAKPHIILKAAFTQAYMFVEHAFEVHAGYASIMRVATPTVQ
jgi:hypothetical protein